MKPGYVRAASEVTDSHLQRDDGKCILAFYNMLLGRVICGKFSVSRRQVKKKGGEFQSHRPLRYYSVSVVGGF